MNLRPHRTVNWFLLLLFIVSTGAVHHVLGQSATWKATMCGVVSANSRLYTIETNGALYSTNLETGKWFQIGKPEFANTQFLFAVGVNLYTIERDGSLYRVNQSTGSWVRVGPAGAWSNTIAGTTLEGLLYTVGGSGALYETNPDTGGWRQVGRPDFGNTTLIFGAGPSLYTIERDGSLYRVNSANGSWSRVGEAGGWRNTLAATTLEGRLYTVEATGVLYETNLATGVWRQVGKSEFGGTRYIFSANGFLYTIEAGNLYKISPADGNWKLVA
ncbi:MAG TPA: hypothetical protein VGQ39_22665 [Pyrinomonadaceae bacterium]|nr:hypothetical protein [Pyrinomonadaceae bacterium]